tara:strand:+ start:6237 stop:6584 length:348 start_codon:yes stop_codon:yes gene_type:complete
MEKNDIINLTFGIFILKILTKILKNIIKKNRPNGLKGGMPSFIGALTLYISTYIILTSNINTTLLFYIIIFIFGTISIKLYYREHNIYQIIMGGIIGFIFSIIVFNLNYKNKRLY